MSLESEKYRRAVTAAINMANKTPDPESRKAWLEYAAEWEHIAESIENAEAAEGSSNDKT
jgi:hypothetical protein